jgi:hypothetical protein
MKNFFVYELFIFIFNLLNQSLITSYIKLPVHTFHTTAPKPEETTKEVYYKYFHDNNIYTILELGWPSQKIVAKLNFDEYPFFIYYNRCIIESSFDLNISKTFKKTPFQHLLTDIYTYTYLVDDSFYFSNKETYKMTYLFSPVNNGTSELKIEKLPYTCAEIGLKIPKPDAKSYNYNFIRELKLLNLINDYTFFIEYNKDNSDEGDIIIGVEPHNYNPDKYKFNQMTAISTAQVAYDLYWQLTFNEIYFNLKDENNETKKISITRLDTGLNHNLNIIIAPYDYMEYIEKNRSKRARKIALKTCFVYASHYIPLIVIALSIVVIGLLFADVFAFCGAETISDLWFYSIAALLGASIYYAVVRYFTSDIDLLTYDHLPFTRDIHKERREFAKWWAKNYE